MKIIFFTPAFNRTGSEIVLFNLINSAIDTFEMRVVSKVRGELASKLSRKVPFFDIESYNSIFSKSKFKYIKLANKALKYLKTEERFLRNFKRKYPADLWYINTMMLPNVVSFAKRNNIPFVLHVHELEQMFVNLSAQQFQNAIDYPSLVIACSNTCAETLKLGGRTSNIEICYPGINLGAINADPMKSSLVRKRHNINEDSFLWIMSGTMDVNKNSSAFVDIASKVLKKDNKANFMWLINNWDDTGYVSYCKNKSITLGIEDKISWVRCHGPEYYDYLNAANGFVLTSFKESFSIVTVEAQYLGKPVVSFDCGGVKEIINHNTGKVIEDFSIPSIVDAMLKIMNKELSFDPFQSKIAVEKFDILIQQKIWKEIIYKYFTEEAQTSL